MVGTQWHFSGDVSLEYGGAFIDLSTWSDGYCTAVRVTDLDSGCGFSGAVLIEHVVINGTADSRRLRDALRSCGCTCGRTRGAPGRWDKDSVRLMLAEALLSYGYSDPDDAWDGYRSSHSEIVQCEPEGPMVLDGWKADRRLHNTTLEAYVHSVHLEA